MFAFYRGCVYNRAMSELDAPQTLESTPMEPAPVAVEAAPAAPEKKVEVRPISMESANKVIDLHKKPESGFATTPDSSGLADLNRAKVYDNLMEDPAINGMLSAAEAQAKAAMEQDPDKQKNLSQFKTEALMKQADEFVSKYPEKAEAYQKEPVFKDALERRAERDLQTELESMRALGYTEEDIQKVQESDPLLLPHEKSTFMMLKGIRESKELAQDTPEAKQAKAALVELYGGKVNDMLRRVINEQKEPGSKLSVEDVKNSRMMDLISMLPDDPRIAESKKQLMAQLEKMEAKQQEPSQPTSPQSAEVGQATAIQAEEVGKKEESKNVTTLQAIDKMLAKEDEGKKEESAKEENPLKQILKKDAEIADKAAEKLSGVLKETDLGEFAEWMLEGGGWQGTGTGPEGGGDAGEEAGAAKQEGSEKTDGQTITSEAILKHTKGDPGAELSLILQGLAQTEKGREAVAELSGKSAEVIANDPKFASALEHALNPSEEDFVKFSAAVTAAVSEHPSEGMKLSADAAKYLLAAPQRVEQRLAGRAEQQKLQQMRQDRLEPTKQESTKLEQAALQSQQTKQEVEA